MMTVTIFTLGRDRQTWTSNHRTDDHDEALQRAVQRRWGKRAFFSAEHGLMAGPEARELAELVSDCAAARWSELRGEVL